MTAPRSSQPACFSVCLCGFAALAAGVLWAEPPETQPADLLSQLKRSSVLESRSGRFVVTGARSAETMMVARWADETAAKVEQLVGTALPVRRLIARISVHDEAGVDRVSAAATIQAGALVQRLWILDYDHADVDAADEALCRLLLSRYVFDSRLAAGKRWPAGLAIDQAVPAWLWRGVARNLYPAMRNRSAKAVEDRWQTGSLMPLSEFLRSAAPAEAAACERELAGSLVAWLASLPDQAEVFKRLFERLADGQAASPEWMSTLIPGASSVPSLEEKWDEWMLRQRRIIREPGKVTPDVMQEFRARLLLYPGDSGIPLTGGEGVSHRFPLRDLIARRAEPWIPEFARRKAVGLRLSAVGRGPELEVVVEAYCRFLQALGDRGTPSSLEVLLALAESRLQDLEARMAAGPSGGETAAKIRSATP